MTRLPTDLETIIAEIDDADCAADRLVKDLSDAQFHWQPNGGRAWSIAQCLEHLATINRIYGAAIRSGVERAGSRGWKRQEAIAPTFFGRKFIASLEPPVTRRVRAPGKVRPGSHLKREDIMRLYREEHRNVRELVTDCADIDVNRATFRNPFLPILRIRVGTGLRVIPAHDRRHLWQAEEVRRTAGFPT